MRLIDGMEEATPLVVEDADRIAYDEKALFHLFNLAREKRLYRADHGARARRAGGDSRCPISSRG